MIDCKASVLKHSRRSCPVNAYTKDINIPTAAVESNQLISRDMLLFRV